MSIFQINKSTGENFSTPEVSYGGHVQIVYIEDRISCQEKFSRPKQSSFWYLEQHISFNTQSTNNEKLLFNKSGFDRSSSGSRTPLKPKHDMNLDLYVISFKEIAALDDYRNHISPSHINEVIQELNSFNSFQSAVRFGEQSFTGYLILNYYKQTLACCWYVQSYR